MLGMIGVNMFAVMGELTTAEVLWCLCSALKMCIFTLFAGTAGLDPLPVDVAV